MKRILFLTVMTTLFTQMSIAADLSHSLDGFWRNDRNAVEIEVVKTRKGIKTQRRDRRGWYEYREVRNNIYQDREGNRYYLRNRNTLVWEAYDGRNRISFRKLDQYSRRNDHYADDYNYRDQHDYYADRDRYGYDRPPHRRYDDYHHDYYHDGYNRRLSRNEVKRLRGIWNDYRAGEQLHVIPLRKDIKARLSRGGWRRFEQRSPGYFVDRKGNSIRLQRDGLLIYQNRRRGYIRQFERNADRRF